jgi:hypothetical protein
MCRRCWLRCPRDYVTIHLFLFRTATRNTKLLNHVLPQITTMSPPTDRKAILEGLRQCIKDGKIIVGAGAGIGLSAKFIEQGGGDMIIIYNSGRYRMAGRGSLAGLMPYGNANDVVLEMVRYRYEFQVT